MANKEALRELQSRLAKRLQEARTQERGKSWLAVECSSRGFLFPLKEAGEIFAMAPVGLRMKLKPGAGPVETSSP